MDLNIYYLELIFILGIFFSSRNWCKRTYWQRHDFWRKEARSTRKKLGCKFIRINTSNAKNGYDLDYKVGNVQAFIDESKNKKIKQLEKKLIKENEMREKVEKEMREKVEKEMREMRRKLEEKLKDKNKELKNLTNKQVTNTFGKIIIKSW